MTADPEDDDIFVPVTCTTCTRIHLVNPKTGKGFGQDEVDMACRLGRAPVVRRKGSIGNIRSLNCEFFT